MIDDVDDEFLAIIRSHPLIVSQHERFLACIPTEFVQNAEPIIEDVD